MTILTIDPDSVRIGIAGEHEGLVCIKENNGAIRPATMAERNLALLTIPNLRHWWDKCQEGRTE
jgi:hypothetical protein